MGNGDHVALIEVLILPSLWHVHLERLMDAVVIVVLEIFLQNSTQMGFAKDDGPVETLSANTPVQSRSRSRYFGAVSHGKASITCSTMGHT